MVGERTAGILNRITETKVNDVTCPKCGEIFGVEFISPLMEASPIQSGMTEPGKVV